MDSELQKTHFTSERQGPNHVSSHKDSKKTHKGKSGTTQSVVSGESKFKENEFTKRRRRSLQLNRRYPLFRVGSERVLLRFKRKSLLDEDDEEKPSEKSGKRHKRKKTPSSAPRTCYKTSKRVSYIAYKWAHKRKLPKEHGYPQIRTNTTDLTAVKESVPNMIKPPPSAPISSVNIGPKNNQFAKKEQAQLATFPFRSEARRPEIVPAWNTFQGTAMAAKMNIRQPVKVQYGNQQPKEAD
ncbi:hypothetical protein OS493_025336 [Desmophyllum pertusum]|uniref:Uncharacterized protein n=1 Tax=Desmophyllum pertusum TaxID=174260 RepID=A0A9W9ZAU5_9CNID|nr:hypothetical protein OS493_025336 [Desmophyllum pertusum]